MPQPPGDGPAEVTVVCITYQHEDYIAAALDSFLSQQTSFRFQVYVGEDCGTDRTADIIRDYAERYPDVIVPFIRESNLGAQRNLIDMCQRAGTKYIAFCEGDDYWIDEHKLQKQHDYMESHPEFSGCFHNTRIETAKNWYLDSFYQPNPDGERLIPFSIPRYDRSLRAMRMGYYLRFGPAHTSSFFLRWNYDLEIPSWYYETVFGDHPLMALQIGNGLLGFLPDVMSVYRRHAGGIIMSSSERRHHLATRRDWLIVLEGLEEHFRTHYGSFAATDIRARMVTEMRNYLVNAVRSGTEVTVTDIIANHPRAFALMMDDYARTSRLRYSLINRLYGGDIAGVRPGALSEVTSLLPRLALSTRRNQRKRRRAVDYEQFSKATKVRGRWLFLCDDQISYRGNVRSFYENVVAAHPEIEAHWLTKSTWVLKLLQSEGLPVTRLKTAESRQLLASAELLVCQSLRSDVFEMRGFNPGLRIVRLLDNAYHNME
ncbi:MAG: glycosyltransferase, partial [Propionicimonas sp.]|nr:glycosyltransferase [Propionicimonas sp.]